MERSDSSEFCVPKCDWVEKPCSVTVGSGVQYLWRGLMEALASLELDCLLREHPVQREFEAKAR